MMYYIPGNLWFYFLPCLLLFIITTVWMANIAKKFFIDLPVQRPFSIFNVEFPGSDASLTDLVNRMSHEVKMQLKKHLNVDFIFMLAVYPGVAILCFKAAHSIDTNTGSIILEAMGWAQIIPWICDIIENIILIKKVNEPQKEMLFTYNTFKWLVGIKFGIALLAITSVLFSMIYIWLIGGFSITVTLVFTSMVAAFLLYVLVKALIKRAKRKEKERMELLLAKTL